MQIAAALSQTGLARCFFNRLFIIFPSKKMEIVGIAVIPKTNNAWIPQISLAVKGAIVF